jgi:hypothetical protein
MRWCIIKKTMKTLLVPALLFALPVYAQEAPNSQKDCEQILAAYAQINVSAAQAELVSQVQKGIVVICKRAIAAEKATAAPTPEEVK